VIFQDSVPKSRVDDMVASIRGTVILYDPVLHIAQVQFASPLSLKDAEQVAHRLETLPEVKSAFPQFNALAQ